MKDAPATVVEKAAAYVRTYLMEHAPTHFFYHNYGHTEELADQAEELAKKSKLADAEKEQLLLAAWFHDTGFTQNYEEHGPAAARIADTWLTEQAYPAESKDRVVALLQKLGAENPTEPLDKLLHDARWSWLGRKRFSSRAKLLRLEQEQQTDEKISGKDWASAMLQRLMYTPFLSEAGIDQYNDRRIKNIADQRGDASKAYKDSIKKLSGKNFGRGIDTLFRTSFRNHITLSRIADGKANMMISINTIVLSIILAVSGAGIGIVEDQLFENPSFILPVITLLLSSLTALVFAVFSARPKITEYNIGQRLNVSKEASMLYFGNFLQIPKETFIQYLSDIKLDQDRLYDDLAKDLYDLGQVLHNKYRLLTVSYNTFVGGLILSVLVFLAVYFFSI